MSTDVQPRAEVKRTALSEGAWRQALRIAIGSVAGLAIANLMNWPFGAFFAVYPVLLLGLVPAYNLRLVAQFIASSVVSILMANVLIMLGDIAPPLAILVFFVFAVHCFRQMALGRWFIFGALSMVSTSALAHLASYPQVPASDLYTAQFLATVLAIFIAGATHALLPERRQIAMSPPAKPRTLLRHQTLLGAICASVSYVVFQLLDLSDSLSAQVATALLLFPMTLAGGRQMAWTRVVGTWIGSLYALGLQLILYTHSSHLLLLLLLYGAGVVLFATMHVRENAGPAVGFSAATAIAVLVGQLSPNADLYGVSLYRFISVAVASFAMLLCIFAVQTVLNSVPATRITPP